LPEPFADEAVEERAAQATADAYSADALGKAAADSAAAPAPAPGLAAPAEAGAGRDAREDYTRRRQAAAEAEVLGEIAASRAEESASSIRARVLVDGELAADPWLDRVRTRLRAGDRSGARASLRLFVERHPTRAIPADLRPLLDE
jgi:hypothetical protein